jgi:hypothetical protein
MSQCVGYVKIYSETASVEERFMAFFETKRKKREKCMGRINNFGKNGTDLKKARGQDQVCVKA